MKIPDMFFEGIIDDVAIYNRALTEKEIRTDMEEPTTVNHHLQSIKNKLLNALIRSLAR